ncbi:MAG: ABC transporter permease [Pseudomonadota bacterium]
MLGLIGQTISIVGTNLRGLPGRASLVLATMICVALVVATLMGLDALRQGLRATLEQSGARDVALLMRGGSQSEINSIVTREQLDVLRSAPGVRTLSPEVSLVVDGYRREDGKRANISLRGLSADGIALRRDATLMDGRWPTEGSAEVAVGRTIAETYRGMDLGAQLTIGSDTWTIGGIFEAKRSVAESEIWADLSTVQNFFNRANNVQSVRISMAGEGDLESLKAFSDADPRLQLAVQAEADYYAVQAARTSELAQKLAWPLATLMAIGAVVGALNIMLASVATRSVEIATLRALGFGRGPICAGLVIECVLLCLIAALIGAAAAFLFLEGLSTSTLAGGITRIGYSLTFTLSGLWQAIGLAIGIGLIGSIVPAIVACLRDVAGNLAK